jgi:multidrug efflux pump subunit AcrA (membrane-fusion protein)
MALVSVSWAQLSYQTESGEPLLFQSAGATQVVEKVRANSPGVLVELFVKKGDLVKKGQLLGHTELDATKLQLDLAKLAVENKSNVESALSQAEAWTVTREETAEAVRRRSVEKSRLEWASAMERMYHANYQTQLEAENVQLVQYEYWKQQYDKRFLRAPVDGVISEVVAEVGRSLNFATHVLTIRNDSAFALPVSVPATLCESVVPADKLPVRSATDQSVTRAEVESIVDDPRSAGAKIIRLLIRSADIPAASRKAIQGTKFDVLLPSIASHE